ncbi:hypothetical protein E2N92_12360 [Methanofollis formosanus]|uniref:Uncharacterized protein n=1 Tax=Methanofollis formosanus TaxID=299308 RepID=A0A8G1A2H2_9EURY|nr:hypothetical protein [Methanofollis formosanus]QYZ80164.1 hypothetical protein E2N92_12360 [Methanofollis formosanus]
MNAWMRNEKRRIFSPHPSLSSERGRTEEFWDDLVVNQFRWVVWVQPECCVKFNVTMKLVETYVEGESLETSKDIQITAGENPVVL